jgi:hypothetical protein
LRQSIAVRTFNDWNDPPPGFFEMDMVAHCGNPVAGSHAHSLVLTDIASGWTEAAAMVVREQLVITLTVEEIRAKLPFAILGLDVECFRTAEVDEMESPLAWTHRILTVLE